jgi:hypothetical protein
MNPSRHLAWLFGWKTSLYCMTYISLKWDSNQPFIYLKIMCTSGHCDCNTHYVKDFTLPEIMRKSHDTDVLKIPENFIIG